MWAAMSKGHTNAINRARRAGFEIEIAPARSRIHDVVSVYAETMERLGAVTSYHFTTDHFERLAELDEAFVAVAMADGEIAGAYLFFESHGIVQMHLGGPRTRYMKPSPSHLLIYSVAVWGRARGNTVVHLGGGVGGSVDDSLFGFKAGFSPRRHAYATLRLVADEERYSALTRVRALRLGTTPDELVNSGFFPAYRAALPSVG
jgi:lipid II:glycine glycyltransferase (peptidoglycan interpeptide bridge formation enzyme)